MDNQYYFLFNHLSLSALSSFITFPRVFLNTKKTYTNPKHISKVDKDNNPNIK